MTGPDQPISLPSNFFKIVQPTSTPMTSLIPPATSLVPYHLWSRYLCHYTYQSLSKFLRVKNFLKTSKSGYMIYKSTKTLPTISCCTRSTACPVFPHTPSVSQGEVLDLSLKETQTKWEHVLSASLNSALDLSVICSNSRLQNGRNTWSMHEGNGNNITRSKYDNNGKIVCPTQTVKVIVSPTETAPAPLCDKQIGFSWDYLINSPMKPDRIQETVPQDSSRRLSTAHLVVHPKNRS